MTTARWGACFPSVSHFQFLGLWQSWQKTLTAVCCLNDGKLRWKRRSRRFSNSLRHLNHWNRLTRSTLQTRVFSHVVVTRDKVLCQIAFFVRCTTKPRHFDRAGIKQSYNLRHRKCLPYGIRVVTTFLPNKELRKVGDEVQKSRDFPSFVNRYFVERFGPFRKLCVTSEITCWSSLLVALSRRRKSQKFSLCRLIALGMVTSAVVSVTCLTLGFLSGRCIDFWSQNSFGSFQICWALSPLIESGAPKFKAWLGKQLQLSSLLAFLCIG